MAGHRLDDAFGWAQPAPGRLALIVADGVGSASRGGEGAELAVDAVCQFVLGAAQGAIGAQRGAGTPPVPKQAAADWGPRLCQGAVRHASGEICRSAGEKAHELATTIVVALLSVGGPERDGTAEVALGRVGDSSAFSLSAEGEWQELFEGPPSVCEQGSPGDGGSQEDMVFTATSALPVKDTPDEVVSVRLGPGAALVLVTDGVAVPLRDGPATVAPMLAQVLRAGPSGDLGPLELARAVDFSRRGALDDRTVMVAWVR